MKDVQCYELFGGIALKITYFLFFSLGGVLRHTLSTSRDVFVFWLKANLLIFLVLFFLYTTLMTSL